MSTKANSFSAAKAVGAATAAIACAGALTAPALASTGSKKPRILSCTGKTLVEPTGNFVLACADANAAIKATKWSSWTASRATGTTTLELNLCEPDCAASKLRAFPHSRVTLEKAKQTSKGLLFTHIAITYKLNGAKKKFVQRLAT